MKITDDLPEAKWMYLKAILFGVMCIGCVAGILAENFAWRTALFLGLAIWSACRLYYFAFYVIEKYIDPSYKFAGLGSFLMYMLRKKAR
jgi:MFS-type transporter involved in bile tolerance (Atg22 family)